MIYCLDTDILVEYFRGNEKLRKRVAELKEEDSIGLTWFSFYEFFKGIFITQRFEEEDFLKEMLSSTALLEESYESAKIGGEIYADLK